MTKSSASTLFTAGGEIVNARVREFFALPALRDASARRRPNA